MSSIAVCCCEQNDSHFAFLRCLWKGSFDWLVDLYYNNNCIIIPIIITVDNLLPISRIINNDAIEISNSYCNCLNQSVHLFSSRYFIMQHSFKWKWKKFEYFWQLPTLSPNYPILARYRSSYMLNISLGRYKSQTGSTRTASPGPINSDRLGHKT